MGEQAATRRTELAALRLGLDLGLTLIDTAEMYGDGGAETLVGDAVAGRRAEVFLVSKVLPQHATRQGTLDACARSLERLKTDYLDLYLLHWREEVPLEETLDAFQSLARAGAIRDYGVSNFDLRDMEQAIELSGGDGIVTNQVLYNLRHRGIEWDLLPWCREHGLPVMAYSPIDRGSLAERAPLRDVAVRHAASPVQIALAWVLHQEGVFAVPKAATPVHVRENRAAADLVLSAEDLAQLDRVFPPPRQPVPLDVK
jgi:diketogulonate reductase-like aldo/keto reductase